MIVLTKRYRKLTRAIPVKTVSSARAAIEPVYILVILIGIRTYLIANKKTAVTLQILGSRDSALGNQILENSHLSPPDQHWSENNRQNSQLPIMILDHRASDGLRTLQGTANWSIPRAGTHTKRQDTFHLDSLLSAIKQNHCNPTQHDTRWPDKTTTGMKLLLSIPAPVARFIQANERKYCDCSRKLQAQLWQNCPKPTSLILWTTRQCGRAQARMTESAGMESTALTELLPKPRSAYRSIFIVKCCHSGCEFHPH